MLEKDFKILNDYFMRYLLAKEDSQNILKDLTPSLVLIFWILILLKIKVNIIADIFIKEYDTNEILTNHF